MLLLKSSESEHEEMLRRDGRENVLEYLGGFTFFSIIKINGLPIDE